MEKQKIYLSGKITGAEGFAEKFRSKEAELTKRGDYVFNPALHPDMFTHGQFMQIDLLALSFCDSIYLMDNWRGSKGAIMEFEQARAMGIPCEFEERDLCLLRRYEGGEEERPTYYSNKKEEFVRLEDITADDFFDSRREAEEKVWSALDWDNGNVQVVPAGEVFGKQKDISLEQAIKNEKDISKAQDAIQAALEENATPIGETYPLTEYANTRFFASGTIVTANGTFRLPKSYLNSKNRTYLLAVADTLSYPSVIIEKETFDEKTEESKPIEIFGKSFVRPSGAIDPVILYRDGENVTIGTQKNFKKFVRLIKNPNEISYISPETSHAAAMILSSGRQQSPVQGKTEKESLLSSDSSVTQEEPESKKWKTGEKIRLNLGNLFNAIKKENRFESTTLIESGKPYDYLLISEKTGSKIRHSVDDGIDHYDLMLFVDEEESGVACRDGETCEVIKGGHNDYYILKQEDRDLRFTFGLSGKDLEIATQKSSPEKSPSVKEERCAAEVFLKDIQGRITEETTDEEIMKAAQSALMRGDSFSAEERGEISIVLKALGAQSQEELADVIRTAEPEAARSYVQNRRKFEAELKKNGADYTQDKNGAYRFGKQVSVELRLTKDGSFSAMLAKDYGQSIGSSHRFFKDSPIGRGMESLLRVIESENCRSNPLAEMKQAKKQDRERER